MKTTVKVDGKILFSHFIFLLVSITSQVVFAQQFDKNFYSVNGEVYTLKRDSCHLYVGGSFNYVGKSATGIAMFSQFNDQMYNFTPELGDNDYIEAAVADGQGGWFVIGNFTKINRVPRRNIAHLNADLSVDLRFVPYNFPVNFFYEIICDENYVYLGGDFSFIYGIKTFKNLIRLNRITGQLDEKWAPNPSAPIKVMKEIGNYLYVGGTFVQISDVIQKSFAVISKSDGSYVKSYGASEVPKFIKTSGDSVFVGGTSDFKVGIETFNNTIISAKTGEPLLRFPTPEKVIRAIPDGSGGWYLFGQFTNLSSHFTLNIGRLKADFNPDNQFKQDFLLSPQVVKSDLLIHNGYLYCGGGFSCTINGNIYKNLIRLDLTSGKIDTSFHPNPDGVVHSLMVIGNTLYLGGEFKNIDGYSRTGLAALNVVSQQILSWNPGTDKSVWALVAHTNGFFVAGDFNTIAGVSQPAFAEFALTGLMTNLNLSFPVNSIINEMIADDSILYIGGKFCTVFKGLARCNIAAFDYKKVSFTSFNPLFTYNKNSQYHWAFELVSDTIFVASDFNNINNQSINNIAALDRHNGKLYAWDINPDGQIDLITKAHGNLLLSGSFEYLKHVKSPLVVIRPAKNVLKAIDLRLSGGRINDIIILGDSLFIGGKFDSINSVAVKNLASYNLKNNKVNAWIKDTLKAELIEMNILHNNVFFYTNAKTTISGHSRNYLGSYHITTGLLNSWNPSVNSQPSSMVLSDTNIIVLGGFTFVNSHEAWNLIKINTCNNKLEDWFPNVNSGSVCAIEILHDTLLIGGSFSKVNNIERRSFCALNKNTGQVLATLFENFSGNVYSIASSNAHIYLAGNFNQSSKKLYSLCRFDRSSKVLDTWSADTINTVKTGIFRQLSIYHNTLFAGGEITWPDNTIYSVFAIDVINGKIKAKFKDADIPANSTKLSFYQKDTVLYVGGKLLSGNQSLHKINLNNFSIFNKNYSPDYRISAIDDLNNSIAMVGDKLQGKGYTNLTFISSKNDTLISEIPVPFNNGEIYCMDISPDELVLGGNYTEIEGSKISKLARCKNPTAFIRNGVFSFSPSTSANDGVVKFEIRGNGFNQNTVVRFKHKGSNTIMPDTMIIHRQLISGILNVGQVDTGYWNLEVTIIGDSTYVLNNTLFIEPAENPKLWIDLIGPEIVVAGIEYTYILSYGNNSNTGLYGVPVAVAVPKSVGFKFDNQYLNFSDSTGRLDSIVSFVESDSLINKYLPGCKVYSFLVPYIGGNSAEQIKLKFTFPIDTTYVGYCIGNPLYLFNNKSGNKLLLANSSKEFLTSLFNSFDHSITTENLEKTANYIGNEICQAMIDQSDVKPVFDFNGYFGKILLANTVKTDIKTDPNKLSAAFFNGGGSYYDTSNNVYLTGFILKLKQVVGVYSMDPNMKYGPSNFYVKSKEKMNYMICFENLNSASSPAQMVEIIDTLDKNVFDFSTFSATLLSFGKYSFSCPVGVFSFNSDYNLSPDKNIIVRVNMNFDTTTGIVRWLFKTIDPNTMTAIKNPLNGFLPPNNPKHDGEGYVLFNISLKNQLPENTKVSNRASIYFDWNLPISTPFWKNVVDDQSPHSKVDSLPQTIKNTHFLLFWGGNDNASGLKHYDIYFSVDSTDYYPLYLFRYDTSIVFIGERNHTYRFYSVATDHALNREIIPLEPDAVIKILPDAIEEDQAYKVKLEQNQPNPFIKTTVLSYYLESESLVSLELLSQKGELILLLDKGLKPAGKHYVTLNAENLNSGIYYYVLKTEKVVLLKKLIVL